MVEQEQKQLVFEDVWLASEVEPLQDNFAILGRVLLFCSFFELKGTINAKKVWQSVQA